jgi:APA family basic amino acid/polyamine antiporter
MRYTHEDIPRSFQVPLGPWLIPLVGILLCIILLIGTTTGTAIRFGIWMGIGHIVYFSYGFWHSKARIHKRQSSFISMTELIPAEVSVSTDSPRTDRESEIIEEETDL